MGFLFDYETENTKNKGLEAKLLIAIGNLKDFGRNNPFFSLITAKMIGFKSLPCQDILKY